MLEIFRPHSLHYFSITFFLLRRFCLGDCHDSGYCLVTRHCRVVYGCRIIFRFGFVLFRCGFNHNLRGFDCGESELHEILPLLFKRLCECCTFFHCFLRAFLQFDSIFLYVILFVSIIELNKESAVAVHTSDVAIIIGSPSLIVASYPFSLLQGLVQTSVRRLWDRGKHFLILEEWCHSDPLVCLVIHNTFSSLPKTSCTVMIVGPQCFL
mmetsp:Transcript_15008/g.24994  ORF Transcript_15008/g.24994 Transcript_15008/m.24994 type:complete len:210 (-) Transcript_15008:1150-1779(-)